MGEKLKMMPPLKVLKRDSLKDEGYYISDGHFRAQLTISRTAKIEQTTMGSLLVLPINTVMPFSMPDLNLTTNFFPRLTLSIVINVLPETSRRGDTSSST